MYGFSKAQKFAIPGAQVCKIEIKLRKHVSEDFEKLFYLAARVAVAPINFQEEAQNDRESLECEAQMMIQRRDSLNLADFVSHNIKPLPDAADSPLLHRLFCILKSPNCASGSPNQEKRKRNVCTCV